MAQWAAYSANGFRRRLLGRLPAAPKPFYVECGLSDRCNLRCSHCAGWAAPAEAEQPARRWLGAIEALRAWAGPYHLSFARGEPLLFPGLELLVDRASSLGVSTCVVTNGTLASRSALEALFGAGLDRLCFSLDGDNPASHDATRGVPGTFDKAAAGLERALSLRRSAAVSVLSIIHAGNLRELPGLVRLAARLGADGVRFQPLSPEGPGWRELWPGAAQLPELDAAIDGIIALKRSGTPVLNSEWVLRGYKEYFRGRVPEAAGRCKAHLRLSIAPDGAVSRCLRRPACGNIFSGPPAELFSSRGARAALAAASACRETCVLQNCNHLNSLGDRARELAAALARAGGRRAP